MSAQKLKNKLRLLLMLPIAGLIVISIYIGYDRFQTYTQYEKLDKLMHLSINLGDLIHELQKERGLSSVYLGSQGLNLRTELSNQRVLSNEKLKNLEEYLALFEAEDYDSNFQKLFELSFKNLSHLQLKRDGIDALKINGKQSIHYYSLVNTDLIELSRLISNFSPNTHIAKQLNSYINFSLAKERAGIEQAIGAYVFSLNTIEIEFVEKFNQLIFEQSAYLYSFEKLSDKQTLDFYKKTVQGKAVEEVNRMRENLTIVNNKHTILSRIKDLAGYGGFIHAFKNYVIRGESKYQTEIYTYHQKLLLLLEKYKSLGKPTRKELVLLNELEFVFNKYYKGLKSIDMAIKNGVSTEDIDKIVKVDDKPAIRALHVLSTSSFFTDPAPYWVEQITLKINLLKKVNDYIIKNTGINAHKLQEEAKMGMIFYIIFSVISLIIFLKLSQLIMKDIVKAVTIKEEELQNIANKLERDVQNKTNELITLNKSLEIKVQQGIENLRKKDELLSQQAKLAAMGEMIGAIAHQWRQPLNALSANIQFLEDDYEDDLINAKFLKEFIKNNMASINFMSKTIDDFRNFFRVDKVKTDFDIKDCIDKPINILLPQLESHNIKVDIEGDSFILNGLASEFQQVVLNIINNAKDALLSNEIQKPVITVKTHQESEFGYLTIEDNAGGISKEVIERIFEPYFTTKEQGKGTGIGLYMSKMIIVDNMQGELSVSNNSRGAVFKIKIKLAKKDTTSE